MDHNEVVSQNRAALRATVDFAEKRLGTLVWEPVTGSEAAAELSSTEMRNDGSPWGNRPLRTAYAAANLMMLGVVDDLKSLERLLVDPVPVIGPTVLARSAIEIASGAWWLAEPGIGARRRVCRELVLSLTSARRAKQIADEYAESFQQSGDPTPVEVALMIAEARQQESTILQRIAELAVAAPTSGPQIENEKADSATDATAKMFKALQPTKLPANLPTKIFYRTYSAVTHGQFYGLTNFMTPAMQPDGTPFWQWGPNSEILDSTIQMAIAAFSETYRRIATVMGWDRKDAQLWDAAVHAIYNT
ncbi:hypothetical protein [Trebonia sp.]|uniref:hypothetical protein n=1 Tax=Trebonia sp. TaxID=2767075 RepID=UPI00261A5AC7|nr:hypothetical protein [Trebonia sp.]